MLTGPRAARTAATTSSVVVGVTIRLTGMGLSCVTSFTTVGAAGRSTCTLLLPQTAATAVITSTTASTRPTAFSTPTTGRSRRRTGPRAAGRASALDRAAVVLERVQRVFIVFTRLLRWSEKSRSGS